MITYDWLKKQVTSQGYLWFEDGEYNLNIIGIRTPDDNCNTFNDKMAVAYSDGHNNIVHVFPITTDPGMYYRHNPANVNGTAIVCPGQHRGLWTFGRHKGKYEALVQNREVKVFRDNDKDSELDTDSNTPTETGFFGINCHHSRVGGTSTQVDKWSAGCQVFANYYDFLFFIALCHRAADDWGKAFTYTLIEAHA